jgi:two-component system sensor histidine kinase/response regulator
LLWSRSQSERIKFQPSELQIKGIVEANILLQRENIKKKEIKIQTRIPNDLLVFADTDMMDTIIRNLLSNAIKFTPNKGIIEIACEYKKGNSIIRISDTGRGIPADVIPDLFRIDKSVSTEDIEGEKGTGLGLILCKEFIDKHNGRIFVESIPGKGSTFTVSLPGKV